ncbi:beta-glucoside-specific PTS transporter subunit IIABC [uncultured Enterococcus sp.]|uniref:beta-glucoside-specific PTS transporter subunit IIABC n=1 Tax=uncultured Enterococcus sp. TaxID=167972 RepID=UPI0003547EB6|nr:beta-glucoside-specific PTS transporter subunit IIABC [uncultured Enterococcus sp.]EPH88592.1 PTS system, beta-glucoside-specific, IIABC component [Enterococcus faecalis 06-MB-DW-09]
MKFENESAAIIRLIGGEKNIDSLVHCATRLRFGLKDDTKANKGELQKLPYVMSVVQSGGQYQVVIGSNVSDYYATISAMAGLSDQETGSSKKTGFNLNAVFEIISGAFSPLIPALAGSGMLKALLTVLTQFNWLSAESSTYVILSAASNAIFYFLPIFLGITLSKRLGANMYVGGVIGAALLEPQFTGLIGVENTNFLGLPVQAVDYATTLFPIFAAIFIYQFVDKFLKKIIYKDIQLFAVPMLSLMIMIPLTVILFGPFGTFFGDLLSGSVMWLFEKSRILSGIVLGGGMTFMVMFGLHWGFTPVTLDNLTRLGGDPIEGMALAAVFAQIGIAVGFFLRAKKHSKMRALAGPVALTGFFAGVTEPIVYGIILRYKRLLPIVAISGGLGGAVLGAFGVTMNAYVFHNIFSLPVYSPLVGYLIGITVSLLSGALLAYFFGVKESELTEFEAEPESVAESILTNSATPIYSPVKGQVMPLAEVEDDVFASGIAGQGIAVIPDEGIIRAPFAGTVVAVFPSKHAIGIKSDQGVELLIHVGLNTVNLNGEFFDVNVENGATIARGDRLLTFDRQAILDKGYQLSTPVIVTNCGPDTVIEYETTTGTIKTEGILFTVNNEG